MGSVVPHGQAGAPGWAYHVVANVGAEKNGEPPMKRNMISTSCVIGFLKCVCIVGPPLRRGVAAVAGQIQHHTA